LAETF
jgi:hypothetical protein